MVLKLKTIPPNSRYYDFACRDYFKDENNRVFCRYHDKPAEFMSADKKIGEPDTPLRDGLQIEIDGSETIINRNPFA